MKSKRQELIVDIVSKNSIETQEELINKLKDAGCEVTQATISRDIRELKLIKIASGHGGYRYMVPTKKDTGSNIRFNSALAESIVSVDYSCNTVVIKTYPGLANAVATGIDSLNSKDILGCVAGDDTIIMITRDYSSAEFLTEKIKDMIG